MLVLTHATLASVEELFKYKQAGFELESFPGYSPDEWGIKAHNRPWVDEVGRFAEGQRVIEVGGAYSSLPYHLSRKYNLDAWVADDFGMSSGEATWSRWGDPENLAKRFHPVRYVFARFGKYSNLFPDSYFDRIITVSTLEHVPTDERLDVVRDMHRCLKPGGLEIHTIDIRIPSLRRTMVGALMDKVLPVRWVMRWNSEIRKWLKLLKDSGVHIRARGPSPLRLLDRSVLVETPRIVYEIYPPRNSPKPYCPGASLLITIEKH